MYELVVLAAYSAGILFLSTLSLGLLTELNISRGSKGILTAELLTLLLATAISVPFSFFVVTDAIIWEFALVGFLNALVLTYFVSRIRNKEAEAAPVLVQFALKHFDTLDQNRDGEYTRADIWACIESGKFGEADVKMFKRLMNRTESIGHVYEWMLMATFPPPSYPIGLYSVNRKDLAAYVQRTSRYSGGLYSL